MKNKKYLTQQANDVILSKGNQGGLMRVMFLPDFKNQSDPATICAGIEVPRGYTVTTRHKFVVLKSKAGSSEQDLALVLGPVATGYMHQSILHAEETRKLGMEISGGGYVTFKGVKDGDKMVWSAVFSESSGDYGVFDPNILLAANRRVITDTMKMHARFVWEGGV